MVLYGYDEDKNLIVVHDGMVTTISDKKSGFVTQESKNVFWGPTTPRIGDLSTAINWCEQQAW